MAQPTLSQVHVDRILTNISVAYMQEATNFVSREVFPVVPVAKKSDLYFTYTKNDFMRDEMQRRADATESAGSGYGLSTATYNAEVWALHKDIGDQTLANADIPLDMHRDATEYLTQQALLRQEIQWVSDYFTTSVWDTDRTGHASDTSGNNRIHWSDYVDSTPIDNIEEGKEQILSVTGREPNTLVLGYQVWRQLLHHPEIVDRHKYTSGERETQDSVAGLLGLDRILVARSIKATNLEGETAAYSFTHGKHALLCYVAPRPSLLTPSAGYQFMWQGVSDGLGSDVGVTRFRLERERADRVEIQIAWDNKVVATDMGYFFSGIVA